MVDGWVWAENFGRWIDGSAKPQIEHMYLPKYQVPPLAGLVAGKIFKIFRVHGQIFFIPLFLKISPPTLDCCLFLVPRGAVGTCDSASVRSFGRDLENRIVLIFGTKL